MKAKVQLEDHVEQLMSQIDAVQNENLSLSDITSRQQHQIRDLEAELDKVRKRAGYPSVKEFLKPIQKDAKRL